MPISADKIQTKDLSAQQKTLFDYLEENNQITSHQAEILLKVKQRRARIILGELVDLGIVKRQGSYRSTVYVLRKMNQGHFRENRGWENFIIQVGGIEAEQGKFLAEQIKLDEQKAKLQKEIDKLEKLARSEKQPNKKFQLAQRAKALKKNWKD